MPLLQEQVIVFSKHELNKDRSPQRIIMRILLTCLGDRFYDRDAHSSKVHIGDEERHSKLLSSISDL